MFGIGPVELIVVFVVALLVFGPSKLPELARGLGKGLREFRRASSDLRRSMELDDDDHPPAAPAQAGSPHTPPEPGSALDQLEHDDRGEELEAAGMPDADPDAAGHEDLADAADLDSDPVSDDSEARKEG